MPNAARVVNEIFERTGIPIALVPTPEGRRFRVLQSQDLRFPLRIVHGGIDGQGRPLIGGLGLIDQTMFEEICRHDVWSFQPTPIYDYDGYRRELVTEYRRLRPRGRVLAHLLLQTTWPYSGDSYFARVRRVHESHPNGILHGTDGREWAVNLGEPTIVSGLVQLWSELLRSGVFDGAVLDGMPETMGWMEESFGPVDWARAGYSSFAELEARNRDGMFAIANALRGLFPKAILIGNSGPRGPALLNGWWRENFPAQNGGSWFTNMLEAWGRPMGLLNDRFRYSAPQLSVLSAAARPEFLLGSACLADAAAAYAPKDFNNQTLYPVSWRAPGATIDRGSGAPDDRAVGWLGRAQGPARQVAGSPCWRRDFVFGSVVVNPSGADVTVQYERPGFIAGGTTARPTTEYPFENAPHPSVWVQAEGATFVLWE